MRPDRLDELVRNFPGIRVLVLGDFFLDQYLVIDRQLAEVSLETGREAHQVIGIRNSPGAAGTVCSNLSSLGVRDVFALGAVGEDGNGFLLLKELQRRGTDTTLLFRSSEFHTPAYIKPMMRTGDGDQELERMDIKNRARTPADIESEVILALRDCARNVDAIVVGDQVQEDGCGIVTASVRSELARLGRARPGLFILADSRTRIGFFEDVMIKPNVQEALAAVRAQELPLEDLLRRLYAKCRRPVFLTRGAEGITLFDGAGVQHIPGMRVEGPIDPVGAGDSATAGIIAALCAGADSGEAAEVGNLVASITIRQLGTTGAASPEQLSEAGWKTTSER